MFFGYSFYRQLLGVDTTLPTCVLPVLDTQEYNQRYHGGDDRRDARPVTLLRRGLGLVQATVKTMPRLFQGRLIPFGRTRNVIVFILVSGCVRSHSVASVSTRRKERIFVVRGEHGTLVLRNALGGVYLGNVITNS